MNDIVYPDEAYSIIGRSFEVYNNLGPGFLEIVYKDALEKELTAHGIPYSREQEFNVHYKGDQLRHKFYADFTAFEKIIVEVKAVESLNEIFYAQCINYLKVSGYRLALLINFGQPSLVYKRFVL